MKTTLTWSGQLQIDPETSTEAFALHQWAKRYSEGLVGLLINNNAQYEIQWKIEKDKITEPEEGELY